MTNCAGRWAEAWEFQAMWCSSSILKGQHEGANAAASLYESIGQFVSFGVRANVGMILYNLTDGSSGRVTAVDEENMTATLAGGTDNLWDTGDIYRIVTIDARQIAQIEAKLDMTASDITAVVSARGACNCLTASGLELLAKLNCIEAAMFYTCSCSGPTLSPEERAQLREWMGLQLGMIQNGQIDLCGGTGSATPAFGSAQIGYTDFASAEIIQGRMQRGLP